MKVTSRFHSNIAFGRLNFTPEELAEYSDTLKRGKELAGQVGDSVLIVHDTCLPQSASRNTGVANISADESLAFFKDMKTYLGINTAEVLPQGEYGPYKNLYCAYTGTSLSLGKYQINPHLLTTEQFGKILFPHEIDNLVRLNTLPEKESFVNYKNILEPNGNFDKLLKNAYDRAILLGEEHSLTKDFRRYITENNDWLEPASLYNILGREHKSYKYSEWESELDRNLYNTDFDEAMRKNRIAQLVKENPEEIEFYKFKQFLADSHLAIGRQKLNEIGIELKGDCLINFTLNEQWAHPKAFKHGHFIGDPTWNIFAMDYEAARNETSDAAKLLARKVELAAKRYDSIRFDVGWSYVQPKMTDASGRPYKPYLGDDVLKLIEKTVKKVKGEGYDLKKLAYEFEASGEDFPIFKPQSAELIDPLKTRTKIYGSTYMHDYSEFERWGSYEIFTKKLGWNPDYLLYGIGNHDPQPLRQIAEGMGDTAQSGANHKTGALKVLAEFFHIPESVLDNPVEFAKAKWAETMQAKNMQMFYMDVFGKRERFDMQGDNTTVHPEKNYAYKIPEDFKSAYQKGLKEGFAFNPMDALEKLFVKNGLDKTQPELYAKIVKYRDILLEEEKVVVAATENSATTSTVTKAAKSNKMIAFGLSAVALITGGIYALSKSKEKEEE